MGWFLDMRSKYRIGLRTIKSAIAVFLCLIIYQIFPQGNALFAAISALICMKETSAQSLKIGLSRFIGTVIGGIFGYLLIIITPHIPYQQILLIFIIPVGIILCISACVWMKMSGAAVICCVVFLIIALEGLNATQTIDYVVLRVVDTSIGIVIGTGLNKYFFPYGGMIKTRTETAPLQTVQLQTVQAQTAQAQTVLVQTVLAQTA